jgi:hypothetical protein
LAFDSHGNLFEADAGTGSSINEFTPSGARTTFASGFQGQMGPFGLVFDSSGNLFVADDNAIVAITPNGQKSTFASGFSDTGGLAFAPVPEPSTISLLGIGAIGLLARPRWRWRKR